MLKNNPNNETGKPYFEFLWMSHIPDQNKGMVKKAGAGFESQREYWTASKETAIKNAAMSDIPLSFVIHEPHLAY